MNKINTVLFDFDGTLMDTNQIIIESWQHTFRTVEGKERPLESIISTFGEPLFVTMEKLLPQVTVEEGAAIYRGYLKKNYTELISPFPGMVELVKELKQQNYKTGLVTSRMKETTRQGLDQFGLADYFDCVITCEDVVKHKPDPEPIYIALERLSAKKSETIMLGDSIFDILCAKNAGVKSVLVSWQMSLTEEDIMGPDGPDYTIEKAEDLFAIL
jgi:pyrophosphatase PpaX